MQSIIINAILSEEMNAAEALIVRTLRERMRAGCAAALAEELCENEGTNVMAFGEAFIAGAMYAYRIMSNAQDILPLYEDVRNDE